MESMVAQKDKAGWSMIFRVCSKVFKAFNKQGFTFIEWLLFKHIAHNSANNAVNSLNTVFGLLSPMPTKHTPINEPSETSHISITPICCHNGHSSIIGWILEATDYICFVRKWTRFKVYSYVLYTSTFTNVCKSDATGYTVHIVCLIIGCVNLNARCKRNQSSAEGFGLW